MTPYLWVAAWVLAVFASIIVLNGAIVGEWYKRVAEISAEREAWKQAWHDEHERTEFLIEKYCRGRSEIRDAYEAIAAIGLPNPDQTSIEETRTRT